MSNDFAEQFPNLFRESTSTALRCHFEMISRLPPVTLISNVNLVPFAGDQVLVIRLRDGSWEIPGGTLEQGEDYLATIRRELQEEAGAELQNFNPFGVWHCFSSAAKPYRLHLPHPESFRLVGWGEVKVVGRPTNPQGGEEVERVERATIEEASRLFVSIQRPDLAELYRLGALVRQQTLQSSAAES
jgi:8-oxo-dGTP pyrophosphatase MutT (NUDIX family)